MSYILESILGYETWRTLPVLPLDLDMCWSLSSYQWIHISLVDRLTWTHGISRHSKCKPFPRPKYSAMTRTIPCWLLAWLLASLVIQQPWYERYKTVPAFLRGMILVICPVQSWKYVANVNRYVWVNTLIISSNHEYDHSPTSLLKGTHKILLSVIQTTWYAKSATYVPEI